MGSNRIVVTEHDRDDTISLLSLFHLLSDVLILSFVSRTLCFMLDYWFFWLFYDIAITLCFLYTK